MGYILIEYFDIHSHQTIRNEVHEFQIVLHIN